MANILAFFPQYYKWMQENGFFFHPEVEQFFKELKEKPCDFVALVAVKSGRIIPNKIFADTKQEALTICKQIFDFKHIIDLEIIDYDTYKAHATTTALN